MGAQPPETAQEGGAGRQGIRSSRRGVLGPHHRSDAETGARGASAGTIARGDPEPWPERGSFGAGVPKGRPQVTRPTVSRPEKPGYGAPNFQRLGTQGSTPGSGWARGGCSGVKVPAGETGLGLTSRRRWRCQWWRCPERSSREAYCVQLAARARQYKPRAPPRPAPGAASPAPASGIQHQRAG